MPEPSSGKKKPTPIKRSPKLKPKAKKSAKKADKTKAKGSGQFAPDQRAGAPKKTQKFAPDQKAGGTRPGGGMNRAQRRAAAKAKGG